MRRNPLASRRGSNAVEFALTMPLQVVLLAGIVDYGWFFHQQLVLHDAVRTGTRVGSMTPQGEELVGRATSTVTDALEANGHGRLQPLVSVSLVTVANGEQAVRVSATAPYQGFWQLVALPLNLNAAVTMRREDQPE